MYFNHLKIYGLGFRISIISQTRIRLDFGWSHVVFFDVPSSINLLKKKNEMLFYSNHETLLRNFIFLLTSFYIRSPYTLKGVFNIHEKIHVKIGKQRQK
jgi:ribosomal protein L6P/L9E